MEKDEFEYSYYTANKDIFNILKYNARNNRKNPTMAEDMLWECLRGKQLGYKFRRQHPVNDFIADFICVEKNLVIEVDGGYHTTKEQREADNLR